MIIRKELLAGCLPVTTANDSRYFLNAMQATIDGKSVRMEATDGSILVQLTDPNAAPDAEFPCGQGNTPETYEPVTTPTLIPAEAAKSALRLAKAKSNRSMPILQCAQLATHTNGSVRRLLITTDLDARQESDVTAAQENTFPATDRVWPKFTRETGVRVCLAVDVLKALIASISASTSAKNPKVTIVLPVLEAGKALNSALTAEWAGEDTIAGRAVLMPCRE